MKALIVFLLSCVCSTALEVRTGLLYQDVPHLWSGFSREPSPAWNVELMAPVTELLKMLEE